jgi:hypothetical protein
VELTDEKRLQLVKQNVSNGAKSMPEKDIKIYKDDDVLRLSLRSSRESFVHGDYAMVEEGKLVSADFGFRIEDICPDLPLQLWYGEHDTSVPLNHGKQIAARLGDRARLRVEDETHFSIFLNWREEILKCLLGST